MTHYQRFLKYFPGGNTFQFFGDKADLFPAWINNPDPVQLTNLNGKGYGIFLTINKTDGKGRGIKNITDVRAVFADMDGVAPMAMLDDMPHLVVESSPGKYHGYWFVDDKFPLEAFRGVQQAIAQKYGSDPAVNDLSRVMRVPGFYHQKKEPVPTYVVFENEDQTKISYNQAIEIWPPIKKKKWSAPKYKTQTDGKSFDVGANIYQLLEKYGWKHCRGNFWTRPGKEYGISGAVMGGEIFWTYTSSTCLEPRTVADCFELVCQYEFGGDKKACARHFVEKNKNV